MNKKIEDKIIKEILLLSENNGGRITDSTISFITNTVLLTEDVLNPNGGSNQPSGGEEKKDEVIRYSLTERERRDELKTLTQLVSSRAKIFDITVTNEDGGNCIMQGELLDFNIKFIFILNESEGIYIKSDKGSRLTEKTLTILTKLNGYYDNWKESWMTEKLTNYV